MCYTNLHVCMYLRIFFESILCNTWYVDHTQDHIVRWIHELKMELFDILTQIHSYRSLFTSFCGKCIWIIMWFIIHYSRITHHTNQSDIKFNWYYFQKKKSFHQQLNTILMKIHWHVFKRKTAVLFFVEIIEIFCFYVDKDRCYYNKVRDNGSSIIPTIGLGGNEGWSHWTRSR